MHFLPDAVRTVLAFAVVLGVLVFIHELGHYLAARWRGVYVEAFSIGFGRSLASWTDRLGTEWRIGWLPLGGYVRLHGQERPEDVAPEVRAAWQPGRTFHEKSVLSRAIVAAAGPAANFLLAMVLFAGLFALHGRPVEPAVPPAEVGDVAPDGPARRAGLQSGDRIVSIDGQPTATFADIQRIVSASAGKTLSVVIHRGDADQTLPVAIETRVADGKTIGRLGIGSGGLGFERLSPGAAIVAGVKQTGIVVSQTVQGLWQMISGQRGTEDLGGPIRIAQLSGQVAELGVISLITFIAVLSVNLGLINLFPIPILDGGHLLFYAAEALRGRPLPARAQEFGYRAGFALVAGLIVFATWNDLGHLGLVRWVATMIG